MKALNFRPRFQSQNDGPASPELSKNSFELSPATTQPDFGVKVSPSHPHGQSRPDNGLHMHAPGQVRRSQLTKEPIKPCKINRHVPLSHPNIGMVRQGDASAHGIVNHICRQQAGGLLPHKKQARLERFLKAKPVGKIDIRIEHDHFLSVAAQEDWIGYFPPARMPMAKARYVRKTCKHFRFAGRQISLSEYLNSFPSLVDPKLPNCIQHALFIALLVRYQEQVKLFVR